jgi:hypothetical protein
MDPDKMVDYNHGSAPRGVPFLAIFALILAVASLAFAVGLWWAPKADARLDQLGERLDRLEKRDEQVRTCLQRNLLPPMMRTVNMSPAQVREYMTTGLDSETLQWVNVDPKQGWHFGVDRRGLKPTGQTGEIGEEAKP